MQMTMVRQEAIGQAANLHGEVAALTAQLTAAQRKASVHEQQLRATQAAMAEQRAAAESAASGSASEVASLAARVAELEAQCKVQADQLGELPGLRALVEQHAKELEAVQAERAAAEQVGATARLVLAKQGTC